ncbi:MAG: hypothetical protein NC830_04025 [Candidatus Omnitrophica bacterium]|nr:hypothetical protein [Candidatus Omnitrophota bacterium]
MEKIGIIGAGGWGTAISILLAEKYSVTLWEKFPEYAETLVKTRENSEFLPGFKIPEKVFITSDIQMAVSAAQTLIIVVPSQYFRNTVQYLKPFYF